MLSKKYYLYRWVRLDKNIPFYIGIGTKTNDDIKYDIYTRACRYKKRNNIWTKIYNKTKCIVEILLESNDYTFIKQKEIEFIKLYGRIDNKTGCLANMTDGGEGTKNVIVSENSRKLRSINRLGKGLSKEAIEKRIITLKQRGYKISKKTKENIKQSKLLPIIQFSIEGVLIKKWKSSEEASYFLKISQNVITNCANIKNTKSFTAGGFIWMYDKDFMSNNFNKLNTAIERIKQGKTKKIVSQEIKENIIKDFLTLKNKYKGEKINELSVKYNINYSTIRRIVYEY